MSDASDSELVRAVRKGFSWAGDVVERAIRALEQVTGRPLEAACGGTAVRGPSTCGSGADR
jgi:hypothetical protein